MQGLLRSGLKVQDSKFFFLSDLALSLDTTSRRNPFKRLGIRMALGVWIYLGINMHTYIYIYVKNPQPSRILKL